MGADGYITIGTKLSTKDLEKDIKKAETELNKLDKEATKLTDQKLTLEADNSELQKTIDKYDDLVNKAENYKRKLQQLEASGQFWSKSYDVTALKLEDVTNEINRQEKGMLKAGEQIDKNNQKLEGVNKKLKDNAARQGIVTEKVKVMNTELQKSRGIDILKGSIDNISNKMSGIIHKAVKWGLAVFSIRSAYSFIRSSISTVSQYNQKIATDIEYIRWAMAMTLKPVIEFIIKLGYQLLSVIRAIIKLLTGYDIFANAGAKAFEQAKNSTSGVASNLGDANKNAKELTKQLAGFDEMNVLSDNRNQSAGNIGGGSGGTIPSPSFDLSTLDISGTDMIKKIEGFITKIRSKIEWLSDYLKRTGKETGGVKGFLLGTWGDFFGTSLKNWDKFSSGLRKTLGGIKDVIRGVGNNDWGTVFKGFQNGFIGILEIVGAFKGQLANVCITIVKTVSGLVFGLAKTLIIQGFTNMRKNIEGLLNGIISWITQRVYGVKVQIDWNQLYKNLPTIISKIKTQLKNLGTMVGNAVSSAFRTVFNKMVSQVESRLIKPINSINRLVGAVNLALPKGSKLSTLPTISLPRLAQGGIINQPGRGVAIAGERGAEGVIPLTDSQQMALLGEAIGKYITVNANITNNMNGRVISRELQKIQNDNNFAYNR